MGIVYSTDKGRICPRCEQPVGACRCKASSANEIPTAPADGIVRIERHTKNRGGKVVTSIKGIALADEQLKQLGKRLKQMCGSGGTVSDGIIEIQGDHRSKLKSELERLGYHVKLAGG